MTPTTVAAVGLVVASGIVLVTYPSEQDKRREERIRVGIGLGAILVLGAYLTAKTSYPTLGEGLMFGVGGVVLSAVIEQKFSNALSRKEV